MSNQDEEQFLNSVLPYLGEEEVNRFLEIKRLVDARDRTGLIKLG